MKKNSIVLLVMIFFGIAAFAQEGRVLGYWLTEEGQSQIEIYKRGDNQYYGKIVWLDEPLEEDGSAKLDVENPDRALRSRPLLGLEILKGFSYDASKGEWSGGSIYDPENGRTYSAYMRLDGKNTLRMRGYVMGMRFLGRSTHWTREHSLRE